MADDPETLRIKANTKIISNVAYHGDLEKKAQMEKQRQINENGEIVGESIDYITCCEIILHFERPFDCFTDNVKHCYFHVI